MKKSKQALIFLASLAFVTVPGQSFAQNLTILLKFDAAKGERPFGDLTLSSDGKTLYGRTAGGDPNGHGTLFSIPVTKGDPTILATLEGMIDNQTGSLTLGNSSLYGMTFKGGQDGFGTIQSVLVTNAGGAPKVLASFDGLNGTYPQGSLTLSADGSMLYGMTFVGGGNGKGKGTIFRFSLTKGEIETLFTFNGANGASPDGSLTLSGSTLYGMTNAGGANDKGTLFSISTNGADFKTLFAFDYDKSGGFPHGDLTLSRDGATLYGTTSAGGSLYQEGTIFRFSPTDKKLTTLHAFTGKKGDNHGNGSLTVSRDGSTLYGMTFAGGAEHQGTIFSISTNANNLKTLFEFNSITGMNPRGGLALSSDGSALYGMTTAGGKSPGAGTVFKLTLP